MGDFKRFKDESRSAWGTSESITEDQIQLGAVLRIADAAEDMAKNYTRLIAERDRYERMYRNEYQENIQLRNQVRGLKSWVTRLKNRK